MADEKTIKLGDDGKLTHEEWFAELPPKEHPEMIYAMAKVQWGWAIGLRLTRAQYEKGIEDSANHPFGNATAEQLAIRKQIFAEAAEAEAKAKQPAKQALPKVKE